MTQASRNTMRAKCLAALLGSATLVSPVWAQQATAPAAEDQATEGEGEILVTAERYGGTVRTTPVSVTAISEGALMERQVRDVRDMVNQVPGIVLSQATAGSSQMKIVVRGAGTETGGIRANGTVGVYIDNVIQPRPNGAFFDFFDVDRVEFLRGPQGTLYGRNTSGGAIKLVTKKPSYDWTGAGQLSVGNFQAREAKAYLSGPLIEDKLAFSISGLHRRRDGFIFSLDEDRRVGDLNRSAERIKLLFEPDEKLTFELAAYAMQDRSDSTVPLPLIAPVGVVDPYATPNRDLTVNEVVANYYQRIYQRGVTLNATYAITDDLEFGLISGYGRLRQVSLGNDGFLTAAKVAANGGRLVVANADRVEFKSSWYTQEANLIYTGERLKAVGGVYYFYEKGTQQGARSGAQTDDAANKVKAPAVFGQATYTIVDGLSVLAGLRYTRETTDYLALTIGSAAGTQLGKSTYSSTTPKLGVNWEVNDQLFTYISWTRGTRSGGFNSRDPITAVLQPTPFGAEFVDSYELGAKLNIPEYRFRVNATAYIADYSDLQLSTIIPNTAFIATLNAGAARTWGLELEPNWQISDSFNLYSNAAFNRGKYTKSFTCGNQFGVQVDCTNRKIKGLPRAKVSAGFRFSPEISGVPGKFTLNGVWDYTSKVYNNIANEPELVQTPKLNLFNASVAWRSDDGRWNASLEGRNLANKSFVQAGLLSANAVRPIVTGYVGEPRQVMARVGFSF
ncbi:TonB-dependent receptor [Sphingomonas crocodyli]|uniref:TonB-dependent receptor n=1 Tax=Sphingomonas crocodyli TaxID=1979270 RepID=A0A437M6P6_9SPHN|nr:TonB-dependent receptor [Sphingomonas crocodyli]RVT93317.1 TonB-dependent receptor [Sphingomonas crocodyli]